MPGEITLLRSETTIEIVRNTWPPECNGAKPCNRKLWRRLKLEHLEPSCGIVGSHYLTVDDKMKLRYVSRKFQLVVSETASLWSDFVLPLYDHRQEHAVIKVLNACGHGIKRLALPGNVSTPTLFQMLSHCSNVTNLRLSPGTKLDSEELRMALQYTNHLEKLEVQLSTDIKPLLQIGKLKDLTVHVPTTLHSLCAQWVIEWMKNKFIPTKLNLVTERLDYDLEEQFIESILQWDFIPLKDYTSSFKLYYTMKAPPLNLSPSLPEFQVEFFQMAVLPFVEPCSFGIFSLSWNLFAVTDCVCDGKKFYKMEPGYSSVLELSRSNNKIVLSDVSNHLKFITEANFAEFETVNSRHLEQLAFACPNLQRLNLQNNFDCLKNLKGLETAANHCRDLRGLNFQYIPVHLVENHLRFWEILGGMKLTHLLIDVCVFYPPTINDSSYYDQLCGLFQRCACLQALQLWSYHCNGICNMCVDSAVKWSVLSCFPALTYCRMVGNHPDVIQDVITNCERLRIFQCSSEVSLSISLIYTSNLQQLSINAKLTNISGMFMKTVSSHGGLVHITLAVNSIMIKGINTAVTNSPKLLTLLISSRELVYNYEGISSRDGLKEYLQKKFPSRKLFTIGKFSLSDFCTDIPDTDLLPLWPTDHFDL